MLSPCCKGGVPIGIGGVREQMPSLKKGSVSGLNTWRYTYNIRQSKGAVSNSLLSNDTAPFDIMAAICNVPGVTVLAFRTPYALLIVAFLLLQRAMSAVALFFLFGLLLAQDLYRASRQIES